MLNGSFLFLYCLMQWEQEMSGIRTNVRCSLCGLFACKKHFDRGTSLVPPHGSRINNLELSLGETVGEPMSSILDLPSLKDNKKENAMPHGPPLLTRVRSEAAESNSAHITKDQLALQAPTQGAIITSTSEKVQTTIPKDDWVICNICKARVVVRYLDRHIQVHTHNFEPSSTVATSTAIVRVPSEHRERVIVDKPVEKRESLKLSPIESYKFRKITNACAASSVTQNGRYSDFTIVLWGPERTTVHNTQFYGGGSSYASTDWERFTIHLVYDSIEDYYTASFKFTKRSQYGYDTDDSTPDRICYQEELFTEIKRALLFHKFSPKSAYKQFRKIFRQKIIVDTDKQGRAMIAHSDNCNALFDRLKKTTSYHSHAHHGEFE